MSGILNRSDMSNLPERAGTRLAYHELTRTLIAHTKSRAEPTPRNRLFFRSAREARFQPVMEFPDPISIGSFALDNRRPFLYFVTEVWTTLPGTLPGTGTPVGDWDGLYRFHLGEHRAERLTWRGDIRPPFDIERTWLPAILSVSDEGRSVFCIAGFEVDWRAEYWMCELELAGMRLKPVTRLEIDVFM